ncbi:hypothetical protein B0H11DRAFT_352278 [Mycena galericulata]|nr:hypothetical protein B0H11DRAFT_579857 [Mycena galericulata]KAJ7505591.1 hypothetical protein B0H11DRAFT_352278 [Mycena galericulata]
MSPATPTIIASATTFLQSLNIQADSIFSELDTETVARSTARQVEALYFHGASFLELAALDYLDSELAAASSPFLQPLVPVFADALQAAFRQSDGFVARLGAFALRRGPDAALAFVKARLVEVLGSLREEVSTSTDLIVYPEAVWVNGEKDHIHLLLVRLRQLTDAKDNRPAFMADLCPVITPSDVAYSKQTPRDRELAMRLAFSNAGGNLRSFLDKIWEGELLSQGLYPCLLPAIEDPFAWFTLLDADTSSRDFYMRLGWAILKVSVLEMVADSFIRIGDPETSSVRIVDAQRAITDTLLSSSALARFLFRIGAYQNLRGSPFHGFDAKYPAESLQLFFAQVYCSAAAGKKAFEAGTAIRKCFAVPVDVLVTAFKVFRACETADAQQPASKRRRVLEPIQPEIAATPSTPIQKALKSTIGARMSLSASHSRTP